MDWSTLDAQLSQSTLFPASASEMLPTSPVMELFTGLPFARRNYRHPPSSLQILCSRHVSS
jgi:hypothetical protein